MKKKHTGGCHCKAVRYEVELDFSQPVIECNCSHCAIKGLLLQFVPAADCTFLSGEDHLTEYRFNTHTIAHRTCDVCGVEPYAQGSMPDGSATVAVNIRTIDDIDLSVLTRTPYDGKGK